MGHTPVLTLSVGEESKEGFWEEVSSTLSPERCISVSASISALNQCPVKNIKEQRHRLDMVVHNPSTQETRRGRRKRKTRTQRKGWRRRRKRKRRKKGRK